LSQTKEKAATQVLLPANLILPLRIFMGITFLYAGIQHLTDPSYFDPSKPGYIGHLISQYAVGSPIHDFLLGAVAPNAVTFGYVVAVGESLIGVAVLLGFLFRIAAFFGLILNFTFFLSATWNAFPYYFGSDIVFVFSWFTLLLTGPQVGLSLDGVLAKRVKSMRWLIPPTTQSGPAVEPMVEGPTKPKVKVPVPGKAQLYPKQVAEVNRAFERIEQQFVSHEETQTILEFVRAFVLSLGVDRNEATKILTGINNIVNRSAWDQTSQ
jgi:thiosulfate dehydrogenase [quinone] large subunit